MTVTVYHLSLDPCTADVYEATNGYDTEDCFSTLFSAGILWASRQYTKIAEVVGYDLIFAYRATRNTSLYSWSEKPIEGLTPLGETFRLIDGRKFGRRSSGMGDIFEVHGTRYLCVSGGFKALEE